MRVVLLEGHDLALRGLSQILEGLPGIDLIAGASTCARASFIIDISRVPADVLVIASDAVDRPQLEALRAVRKPAPRVLALLKGTEQADLDHAVGLGADGYAIEADLSPKLLFQAVGETHRGTLPMPAILARFLLVNGSSRGDKSRAPFLTGREGQVLGLLANGSSNKQIARALAISEHGAKHHVGNILAKLHCSTRAAAVAEASRLGLLDCTPSPGVVHGFQDPGRDYGHLASNQ